MKLSSLLLFSLILSLTSACLPNCPYELIGDGVCQQGCFNLDCNFDLGDCGCSPQCLKNSIGNGMCNTECLIPACDWDRGDCDTSCADLGCNPRNLNDGICNQECNLETCGYDRGDCLQKTVDNQGNLEQDLYIFDPEYVGKSTVQTFIPFGMYLFCIVAGVLLIKQMLCQHKGLIDYKEVEQISDTPRNQIQTGESQMIQFTILSEDPMNLNSANLPSYEIEMASYIAPPVNSGIESDSHSPVEAHIYLTHPATVSSASQSVKSDKTSELFDTPTLSG